MKINLKSLVYDNSLTINNEVNVIYLIINLINDHKYVGQAKNLFDRFRSTSYMSHKSKYEDSTIKTYLYNALRKYGLENFEVEILESNCTNLNDREIYWIAYYHTYFRDPEYNGGYNMTAGGADHKAFTDNAHKRLKELYPDTNGAPTEWITAGQRSGRIALLKKYPNTNGVPPALINSHPIRTADDYKRMIATKRVKYGDDPNFYAGTVPTNMVTAGAEAHAQNSIIRAINSRLQYLKDNNYEITSYNYYNYARSDKSMWDQHIPRILKRLSNLKNHPDWTEEMTDIFSHIIPNPDKTSKGRYKFIIV